MQKKIDLQNDQFNSVYKFYRREALQLMGASLALAGLSISCRRPVEKIIPYIRQPELIIPGNPNYFATAIMSNGNAIGIVVESHEGRPTKIEGNKLHPSSLGASSSHMQASVLQLYDPDRAKLPIWNNASSTWARWKKWLDEKTKEWSNNNGKGLAFLTTNSNNPTSLRLQNEIKRKFPDSNWFLSSDFNNTNKEKGTYDIFGDGTRIKYNLDKANIIVSIHNDFLMLGDDHLRHAKNYAKGKLLNKDKSNRLYVIESDTSVTGSNADNRLSLAVNDVIYFMEALCYELFVVNDLNNEYFKTSENIFKLIFPNTKKIVFSNHKFVKALAVDLIKNKSKSILTLGNHLPSSIHALCHVINIALNGIDKTFNILDIKKSEYYASMQDINSFSSLLEKIEKKEINELFIIDNNPVYRFPFIKKQIIKIPTVITMGIYKNETGHVSDWHLPISHFLENWDDGRSYDGTISIIQPLIAPLYNIYSKNEILHQILSNGDIKSSYDLVRDTFWNKNIIKSDKEWNVALHDGLVEKIKYKKIKINLLINFSLLSSSLKKIERNKLSFDNLELICKEDYSIAKGEYSNVSWLQELGDPITRLAWGNALLVSPKLAKKYKLSTEIKEMKYETDIVSLSIGKRKIFTPIFVLPGLPSYSMCISMGYGRTHAGFIGNNIGVNIGNLLNINEKEFILGVKVNKTNKKYNLSAIQIQLAVNSDSITKVDKLHLGNRDIVRSITLKEYKTADLKKNSLLKNLKHKEGILNKPIQVTRPFIYDKNAWGMVIDLNLCIGCSFCVIACQAENNIPVVGSQEVKRGRAMHWLRVDRYFIGPVDEAQSLHQPVACAHCENAPCEAVCPVAATVHDKEGLNTMVYNRCIGTRYCANNCPYKVRRFNYFDFTNSGDLYVDQQSLDRRKLLEMQYNPDVTIRYRGVMEKCTYCTQRIEEAKIAAKRIGNDANNLKDGTIIPACAQACPTNAIIFGNINDKSSNVYKLKNNDREYEMLEELNIRPRTSYLIRISNPNLELI